MLRAGVTLAWVALLIGAPTRASAAPLAPVDFGVAPTTGGAQLVWSHQQPAQVHYFRVYVSLSSAGPFSWMDSSFTTSYAAENLLAGLTYYFALSAVDVLGAESPMTAPVAAVPLAGSGASPDPPAGFSASPGVGTAQLQWQPVAGDIWFYKIHIGFSPQSLSWWSGVLHPQATAVVPGLIPGVTYYVAVSTVDTAGRESALAGPLPVVPTSPVIPPSPPQGFVAEPGIASVRLLWQASAGDVWFYKVYAGVQPNSLSWLTGVVHPGSEIVLSALPGLTYYFAVSTVNHAGLESPSVGPLAVVPLSPPGGPQPPEGVVAEPGAGMARLQWQAGSVGIWFYKVYAGLTPGSLSWLTGALHPSSNLDVMKLYAGVTHYFAMSAVDLTGAEGPMGPVVAVTPMLPDAPSVTATPGDGEARLSWTPPSGDISQYRIYLGVSPGGPFGWFETILAPQTETMLEGLLNGANYYFRVSAFTSLGQEGAMSAPVHVLPTGHSHADEFLATPGNGDVRLEWPPIQGASDLRIEGGPDEDPWQVQVQPPDGATSLSVGDLANDRRHTFRLLAVFDPETGEHQQIAQLTAFPSATLGFSESPGSYVVQYYNGGKPVRYRFRKETAEDSEGRYEQFASEISFDGVPVTAQPYPGGRAGLALMGLPPVSYLELPTFDAAIREHQPGSHVELLYWNRDDVNFFSAGSIRVAMRFEAAAPYLDLRVAATSLAPVDVTSWWHVFPAIGGSYTTSQRIVVPWSEDEYYVIDGHALGIHYFPRQDNWSLRMGVAGTPHERVTTGFFFAQNSDASPLQIGYPMGNDYCTGASGDPQDAVQFGLDQVFDELFVNYQEDEGGYCNVGGLGYAWQNSETRPAQATPSLPYLGRVLYWVGEDDWAGSYGLNAETSYRFRIDAAQAQAAQGPPPAWP
jgi:hypothetical protein